MTSVHPTRAKVRLPDQGRTLPCNRVPPEMVSHRTQMAWGTFLQLADSRRHKSSSVLTDGKWTARRKRES
jgi:hypothetical protein